MVGSCHHNTLRNSNVVLLTRSAIGAWNTASFRCKNVCRTATKLTFVVLWNVCTNDISKKIPTAFQIYHRRGFAIRVGMLIWQGEEIEKSPSANLFVYQQSTITMHTKYTNKLNRTIMFPHDISRHLIALMLHTALQIFTQGARTHAHQHTKGCWQQDGPKIWTGSFNIGMDLYTLCDTTIHFQEVQWMNERTNEWIEMDGWHNQQNELHSSWR